MLPKWRYRIASILGVTALSLAAVYFANLQPSQRVLTTHIPLVNRLDPVVLTGGGLAWALLISTLIVLASFVRLFRPEPRRVLDIVFAVEKRVAFSMCAIATLGYFKWSHRLPRQTVILTTVFLSVTLPVLFVMVSQSPTTRADRSIVVGDDPRGVERIADTFDRPLLGYVAPPTSYRTGDADPSQEMTDGGAASFEHGYIGGLSRLEDAITEHNVDSAVLAFEDTDRSAFFGAVHVCHEHGVDVKTHADHADSLLTDATERSGPIVDVDIEPWDVQDRLFKRAFDLAFAGSALLVLSPIILLIAAAIRIEGNGPVFFTQTRTYRFGDTFTVYKFRTLKPEPEGKIGTTFAEDRETPLGNLLRMTHLDEIPQLWSILAGDMSVVGPRPAQTELESEFESEAAAWKQRWFVKPGLTGLAQVNDATSEEPELKIDYDIEYIRQQSFVYDVKIVMRQLWQVARDVLGLMSR